MKNIEKDYWLMDEPEDVVSRLETYHNEQSLWLDNPIMKAWSRNEYSYYNAAIDAEDVSSGLAFAGEQGELVKVMIPQARLLIRQLCTLITKQKLDYQAVAEVEGMEVLRTVRLANAIATQEVDNQDLDAKGEALVEQALVLGASYLSATWRSDLGEIYSRKGNNVTYSGDVRVELLTVRDVYFDYLSEFSNASWAVIRTKKNRWDLIAQFEDLRDAILSLPSIEQTRRSYISATDYIGRSDLVWCYELYHKPTPAMPKGRMLMYSDHRTIYYDGDNHYGCIPVVEMKPYRIFNCGLGYPKFTDLLPAQEMLDHCFSVISTNQSAFAVQSVAVPRGAGISVQDIGGMNFYSYTPQNVPGGGKPEAINLTNTPAETFNFLNLLNTHLDQLADINAAMRGTPPPGVTSGVAIATLTTNALEFLNSIAKSYQKAMENIMLLDIDIRRRFTKIPHSVTMQGPNNQRVSRKYVGKELDPIKSVRLSVQNPLMKTMAGRADIAEKLMQSGLIKDVQDYISILDGAPLSVLYKSELSENDLIQSENEKLIDGDQVPSLSTDDHPRHIREHGALLNDPIIRMNQEKTRVILEHILEHYKLAKETDPFLTQMIRTGTMPEMQAPAQPSQPAQGLPVPMEQQPIETMAPAGEVAQPANDMLARV